MLNNSMCPACSASLITYHRDAGISWCACRGCDKLYNMFWEKVIDDNYVLPQSEWVLKLREVVDKEVRPIQDKIT